MKNILKNISIFVVGAALGVAGSYKFFETKFQNIADEEIESMKMAIKNNRMKAAVEGGMVNSTGSESDGEPLLDASSVVIPKVSNVEQEEDIVESNEYEKTKKRYSKEEGVRVVPKLRERVNYTAMSESLEEEAESAYNENDIDEHIRPTDAQLPDGPMVISVEEFVSGCDDYDQITLTYYAKDHTMTDENNEPFNDYIDYIGPDTLNHFGAFECGDNLVYVRNDKKEIAYEIVKVDEFYA